MKSRLDVKSLEPVGCANGDAGRQRLRELSTSKRVAETILELGTEPLPVCFLAGLLLTYAFGVTELANVLVQ